MEKYLFQQPLLAKTSKLVYYLRKIDKNRYYSNFGPLYKECKKKIEKNLGLKKNNIIFTSSGFSSLLSLCYFVKKKILERNIFWSLLIRFRRTHRQFCSQVLSLYF